MNDVKIYDTFKCRTTIWSSLPRFRRSPEEEGSIGERGGGDNTAAEADL